MNNLKRIHMKKVATLFFLLVIFLSGCTRDQGPEGPDCNPDKDGGIIKSSSFDIQVNLNGANNFSHTENYGFQVSESDVTLVYIFWGTEDGKDLWRMLPQTVIFELGTLIYNFDFTQTDVRIFLNANFDLNLLS